MSPRFNVPFIFIKPHALTPGDPTWKPCTVMRTVSPTFALLGDIKSLGPLGAAEKRKKTKRQRSLCYTWRANPAGLLVCHRRRETNTISCQLRSQGGRRGTCRFFHPKDCAGFIPPWREKELNWVDTHYFRRMGVHWVECGGSAIRDTQRANSLVLVWTAAPR